MRHGGDIYTNKVMMDYSVNLNPVDNPAVIGKAISYGIAHANEYPDIEQTAVRHAIARADKVTQDHVLAGNGASELIMSVAGYIKPRKALVIGHVFGGYEYAVGATPGCKISRILPDKKKGFTINKGISDRIPPDTDMIFISDPIAHTGRNILDSVLYEVLEYAARNHISVLLDECFFPLSVKGSAGEMSDAGRMIELCPDLYIIRSYTKLYSLPGIRMGYLISSPEHITDIRRRLPEWNLSGIASYVMEAGSDPDVRGGHIRRSCKVIEDEKLFLEDVLMSVRCETFPSDSVYIAFRSDIDIYRSMLEHMVLIRDLSEVRGLGKGYMRIAVKDHDTNVRFAQILKEITDEDRAR